MTSLRQVRAHRLLTIRELASRAGVAPGTVYSIEAGRSKPLLRVIRLLAAALDVDPNEVDEFREAMDSLGMRDPPSRRAREMSHCPATQ
jgi:transcriptional regulator with XRE-family HTH domain